MRKFLIILCVVLLPAALLIGYVEIKLRGINTHYATKAAAMERQLGDIEILSLGSSNGYFDINPAYFSRRGYNLAFNAQSPFYDYQLLNKYIDRMPKLKVVILPAILFTMGTNIAESKALDWRMYFYANFFNLPLETDPAGGVPLGTILEPKTFSKIALYGANVYTYMTQQFSDMIDYYPEPNGWFNSVDIAPAKLENKNGEQAAKAHNLVDEKMFPVNLAHWQKLVDILKAHHIECVVVRLPSHPTYYMNLDKGLTERFKAMMTQFAKTNAITFVDYTEDKRFTTEDYTFMIDHLGAKGAEKFTRIFNKEVLEKFISSPK